MTQAPPVSVTATARLPTRHGEFSMDSFRFDDDPTPHLALTVGLDPSAAAPMPMVRVHSECATGELFGSLRCDCAEQLDESLRRIQASGCGVLVYLRQEGRGIGIENKLRAYALQDQGLDTVEANLALGLPVDARSFDPAVAYLSHRGVSRCQLLTNNPEKVKALEAGGIEVDRVPLKTPGQAVSHAYLETKRQRMGHDV
ncbi:MAG: GTP cyclohydrolase II [Pseudomonadales bacterium]